MISSMESLISPSGMAHALPTAPSKSSKAFLMPLFNESISPLCSSTVFNNVSFCDCIFISLSMHVIPQPTVFPIGLIRHVLMARYVLLLDSRGVIEQVYISLKGQRKDDCMGASPLALRALASSMSASSSFSRTTASLSRIISSNEAYISLTKATDLPRLET